MSKMITHHGWRSQPDRPPHYQSSPLLTARPDRQTGLRPPERNGPRSVQEVVNLVEAGKVSPAEAFSMFRELEKVRDPRSEQAERQRRLERVLSDLNALVGLDNVKQLVGELSAFVQIQQRRADIGLITEPLVLHMVFRGNPGTGKTTVARYLGKIFQEMGVLEKGHLTEVERADLVGEYIGHTAQKTREQVRKALGGILFIDEAYSLARGGEKDFGKEAIDCLVKAMEDHKNNLILILAGYRQEMDYFMRSNPGLRSRFPIHLTFTDYSVQELLAIADQMVHQRQYRLSREAREELHRILENPPGEHRSSIGNARLVRNLIEKAIRRQAVRLVEKPSPTKEELMEITPAELKGILEA